MTYWLRDESRNPNVAIIGLDVGPLLTRIYFGRFASSSGHQAMREAFGHLVRWRHVEPRERSATQTDLTTVGVLPSLIQAAWGHRTQCRVIKGGSSF